MKKTGTHLLFRVAIPLVILAGACGAWCTESADQTKPVNPVPPATHSPIATTAAPLSSDLNTVVMTVNGTPIKRGEVDRIISLILASNPDKHKPSPEMRSKAEVAARQKLIEMVILYDIGQKEPPADLDKQVATRMTERKKQFATNAAYNEALGSTGMTEADLREFTRKEVIISSYVQKTFIDTSVVTDDEARAFYDKNHEKFKKVEETRRVSHILIGFDTTRVTPEKKMEYRDRAQAIRDRLAKGENFEAIALKESTCPSGRNGGDLSYIGKGQMMPAFERSAFDLKKGEISPIVETRQGYHIIKLVDIKEAEYIPYAETKDKIKDFIRIEEGKKKLELYLAAEKAKATITMASSKEVPSMAKSVP